MSNINYKSTLHACYLGYITQALIVNLPPLLFVVFREKFGLSYTMLGSIVMLIFVTQLIVDALAVEYVDKIGHRTSAVMAHAFAAVGMIALAFLPRVLPYPFIGLIISSILFSIGGGLIEVLVSPIVESLPSEAKASSMSLLHSFYSWGQVLVIILSTLALLFLGQELWFFLPLVWSLLPLYTLFKFTRVPLIPPEEESKRTPLKTLFRSRIFLIALLLMICSGASEQSMAQWASLFAEKGLGISKTLGDLLGPCLFAVMMGIVRTWYGMKGQKVHIHKILVISSVLCMASFVITAIVPIPAISLLGCALCGLSVSLMWPGMLSLTAASYPSGGVAMFAILALAGDLGCSVGPQLIGIIADSSSLNWGLLTAIIFPTIMLVGLVALKPIIGFAGKQRARS
ncbi:MFS transporter [Clostridium thermosuccinogenes]|uniref:MFS transporter n=1 Tax=Clostridium thermosuccinogenes TaxID=84032 RepID=A0A2K2F9U5_9CLOT|nr:MFS transporter [Pseudoclostridium thermosuccinogenes]AUS97142.1 MFS transporter [Pseudoclostridium thermosuccinogenes]PNT95572.1 MFS transporter [Pseudoclostridium thermosuccinogenes]PNT96733.1 MFS transporter [Pseudoclostridium thermosuccinogenes]